MKTCKRCKTDKPLDQFPKGRDKDGLYIWCRDCNTDYHRERRHSNPAIKRRQQELSRKRKYGLHPDQYSRMLEDQNYTCAICFTAEPLLVDHCHKSGRVRGLLCKRCNTILGLVKDSRTHLQRAQDYLNGLQ